MARKRLRRSISLKSAAGSAVRRVWDNAFTFGSKTQKFIAAIALAGVIEVVAHTTTNLGKTTVGTNKAKVTHEQKSTDTTGGGPGPGPEPDEQTADTIVDRAQQASAQIDHVSTTDITTQQNAQVTQDIDTVLGEGATVILATHIEYLKKEDLTKVKDALKKWDLEDDNTEFEALRDNFIANLHALYAEFPGKQWNVRAMFPFLTEDQIEVFNQWGLASSSLIKFNNYLIDEELENVKKFNVSNPAYLAKFLASLDKNIKEHEPHTLYAHFKAWAEKSNLSAEQKANWLKDMAGKAQIKGHEFFKEEVITALSTVITTAGGEYSDQIGSTITEELNKEWTPEKIKENRTGYLKAVNSALGEMVVPVNTFLAALEASEIWENEQALSGGDKAKIQGSFMDYVHEAMLKFAANAHNMVKEKLVFGGKAKGLRKRMKKAQIDWVNGYQAAKLLGDQIEPEPQLPDEAEAEIAEEVTPPPGSAEPVGVEKRTRLQRWLPFGK